MALQPPGATVPLAHQCSTISSAICIDKYASSMPYPFYRSALPLANGSVPTFPSTSIPNDPSFALTANASFLVFDEHLASKVLGQSPTYDFIFPVSSAVHEAPVYVPSLNKLFLSVLAPPPGHVPQLVIDLNQNPPTLSDYLPDPPVYAPNGGTYHNGKIYWGASGSNASIAGTTQRPGIRTTDPHTNKTETLLNNYNGFYFNTVDDLFIHPDTGEIWFTDPFYSWWNALADIPPQIPPATYRFNPKTGSVVVVDTSLTSPNGIALSPDGKKVYISDTGASGYNSPISPFLPNGAGTPFNSTYARTIFKYNLVDEGRAIVNKRPIYLDTLGTAPDGLKVAQNGMVLTGSGNGVDVLTEYGDVVLRVQTNYTVQNFAWVRGEDGMYTEFWLMGQGGISRVRWNLAGQVLT